MRISSVKLLALLIVGVLAASIGTTLVAEPASAAATPSFKVACYPTGIAADDPIVFPGQPGRSHMHSFYGAKGVSGNTTTEQLIAGPPSQCGSYYDSVDRSAYWIPTLYKNGQQVYSDSGSHQLAVYYERAGGPSAPLVAQAFPRGLKMIAGDMRATSPQGSVNYACAKIADAGRQSQGSKSFPSCGGDELLIAKLTFPDCWDGRNLDSTDHKSHMAYSDGGGNCTAGHPVKLPRITFEAWFHDVNGPASSFSWASGGAYTFHGDLISVWDTRAAANLVNQCINVAVDCNPYIYPNIPVGNVTQAQIDAQLTGVAPVPSAPAPPAPGGSSGGHTGHGAPPPAAALAVAAAAADPRVGAGGTHRDGHQPEATVTASPSGTASNEHGASGSHSASPSNSRSATPSASSTHHAETFDAAPAGEVSTWAGLPIVSGLAAVLLAIGTVVGLFLRRRRL